MDVEFITDISETKLIGLMSYVMKNAEIKIRLNAAESSPRPMQCSIDFHIKTFLPIADSKRKFSYLDDGVTNREYALAIINQFGRRQYRIVDVEGENHSFSLLILYWIC
jgi:hypothetical protein